MQTMRRQVPKSENVEQCVGDCLQCYRTCMSTMRQCLEMGGRYTEVRHMELMDSCSTACVAAADFMLRGSEFYQDMCGMCAEVCTACGESCADFGEQFMQECAKVCRRCAASCRKMTEEIIS